MTAGISSWLPNCLIRMPAWNASRRMNMTPSLKHAILSSISDLLQVVNEDNISARLFPRWQQFLDRRTIAFFVEDVERPVPDHGDDLLIVVWLWYGIKVDV